jgi:proteasome accessory factor A
VIIGDANMAEVATYLKVGVTAIVLAMIEDDYFGEIDLTLAAPVQSLRKISYDLSLSLPVELADGRSMTALEMQWELLDLAKKYAEDRGLEAVDDEVGRNVLERWESTLSALEVDPMTLNRQLDWVAKYELIDAYRERHGLEWDDPKLAAMDLQYHDVRPAKSLFARLDTEKIVDSEAIDDAITEPPPDTRAYFRGKCLQRWAGSIAAANWDSLVFDLGSDPLRRVPMMEPLRGTAAHVDTLLKGCATPAELLTALES